MHARLRRHKARLVIALCCAVTFGAHNFATRAAAAGHDPLPGTDRIVMNTREQLRQAFAELREGTFLKETGIQGDASGRRGVRDRTA